MLGGVGCVGDGGRSVVYWRFLVGPFDGGVLPLPNGWWVFVHSDGAPVVAAPSLGELWERLREEGLVEGDARPEDSLYLERGSLDDPVVYLRDVPPGLLEPFLRGEVSLRELAGRAAGGRRVEGGRVALPV